MKSLQRLALLSALFPLAFISGCGGGSNNSPALPAATATPQPNFTPGPTLPTTPMTIPENQLRGTILRLPNKQVGILTLTRVGNTVAGALQIINRGDGSPLLPLDTFPVSGEFAAPNAFDVKGTAGSAGDFTLSGVLPGDQIFGPGSFNLTLRNISYTGVLPQNSGETAPAPTPFLASGDLQFSDFSTRGPVTLADYPFDLFDVAPNGAGAFDTKVPGFLDRSAFDYTLRNNGVSSSLRLTGVRTNPANARQNLKIAISLFNIRGERQPAFQVGQTYDLQRLINNVSLNVNVALNGVPFGGKEFTPFVYSGEAGTMTILSIGPDSITCELKNVRLNNYNQYPILDTTAFPNDGTRKPVSSFVLNGKIDFSGVEGQTSYNLS